MSATLDRRYFGEAIREREACGFHRLSPPAGQPGRCTESCPGNRVSESQLMGAEEEAVLLESGAKECVLSRVSVGRVPHDGVPD